ncbi:MAG: hypothetical protein HYS13_09325 [Planctomycetia bacterium]|nr:hypothetical protein [Planctomycetia bacterium]
MSPRNLEQRVDALEAEVTKIQGELRRTVRQNGKDWRRTIGAFTGDEGMQEILREAMRLRKADRKKARTRRVRRVTR